MHKPYRPMFILGMTSLLTLPLFSTRAVASQSYAYGTLHKFGDGSVPVDGVPDVNWLVQGPDGNLYGETVYNTAHNNGALFKTAPDGSGYTILHLFSDGSVANDGYQPEGALVVGPDGNLWGTTQFGGTADEGIVFRIAPDGSGYTIVHNFGDGSVTNEGQSPNDGLILGIDGNFYGTTNSGGNDANPLNGGGTVFKVTPTGVVTTVHSFPDGGGGPDSGNFPMVGVIQGPDGTLYGMTNVGGTGFAGGIYKINPDGSGYTILHNFSNSSSDGSQPFTRLLLAPDGKLYGTTSSGGPDNDGVIFRLNTDGSEYTIVHLFTVNSDDGEIPYCALTAGPDGNLYGDTYAGGKNNLGTIYQVTPSGTYSTVYSFDGAIGTMPEGNLLLASDGNFYGLTTQGGAGIGTIFRFSPIASLGVSAPASVTAGVPFNATVTARNFNNNAVTDYSGAVHFTSDDPKAALPADTLVNGIGSIPMTLYSAATKAIRVRDTGHTDLTGIANVPVNPGPLDHLSLTVPTTATAGFAFQPIVSARDQYENIISSFTDTVHFASTSTQSVLPADFALTGGAKQISVKLNTPGTQTITATDTANSMSVTSTNINVGVSLAKLVITGPATVTAGTPATFTVSAQDTVGNIIPTYSGTVHITSNDANATLPADVTLTGGTGSFSIIMKKAATSTVTATDTTASSLKGTAVTVVNPAAATTFTIIAPATATSNTAFQSQITVLDAYGNVAKGYTGTVHFTSSDPNAVLPANTTLPIGTKQVIVKLKNHGSQTFTVTDMTNTSITGTSSAIGVN